MSGSRHWMRGIWTGGMALIMSFAHAQHWIPSGVPSHMIQPSFLCEDGAQDALYVGGIDYFISGGITNYPIFRYQNGQWDTLGLFGNVIKTAIIYHDTLLVGGGFTSVQGEAISRIACYVNGAWHPYGSISNPSDITRLRIIDGELYALGIFDDADGHFCNGLAKRVGAHWEPVGTLPAFNGDGSAWFHDVIQYQGKLIVTGNFTSADQTINDIMSFDGTSWQSICQCLSGGFDGGAVLAVYQGSLYLGGTFHYGSGSVGQGVMYWDGVQWHRAGEPGGGLQLYDNSDQYTPPVHSLLVHNGLLFVSGGFSFADHLPTSGIATWDGNAWCSLGGSIEGIVSAITFYHDTLYVGCGYHADGELVNGVARFIGSSYQEECATTGIKEAAQDVGLRVLQSGSDGFMLIGLSDGKHNLRVYDAQARLVLAQPVVSINGRTREVSLWKHTAALYLIQVDEVQRAKYIPVQ